MLALIVAIGLLIVAVGIQNSLLIKLIQEGKHVATTLQQLDAAIAANTAEVAQLVTDINALIALVQAIPGQDFTNEVNAINADIAQLQGADTAVTGESGVLSPPPSGSAQKPA